MKTFIFNNNNTFCISLLTNKERCEKSALNSSKTQVSSRLYGATDMNLSINMTDIFNSSPTRTKSKGSSNNSVSSKGSSRMNSPRSVTTY